MFQNVEQAFSLCAFNSAGGTPALLSNIETCLFNNRFFGRVFSVHATLIKVGGEQCVRLPRSVVKEVGLLKDLDVNVVDGALIIRPSHILREGWGEAAAACHHAGDDGLSEWEATACDFSGEWT